MNPKISCIFVGSDHAGFEMKEAIKAQLLNKKYKVEDQGTYDAKRCDYPDFAKKVCIKVSQMQGSIGILVCGSGIGISIAANKMKGIRCAVCQDSQDASQARSKEFCNVMAFGGRTIGIEEAKFMVDTFVETNQIEDESFLKKIKLYNQIEATYLK